MTPTSLQAEPPPAARLRSTRTAVIALLLVAVVLPGTTGGLTLWRSWSVIEHKVEQGQSAAVDGLVANLAWSMQLAEQRVANGATSPDLRSAISEGNVAAASSELRAIVESLPLYRTLAVVDERGRTFAAWPLPLATSSDVLTRPGAGSTVGDMPLGLDGIVTLRMPTALDTHLVAEVSLHAAAPQLQTFQFGRTGTATLVNRDGRVLLAGNPNRRNQTLRAPEVVAMVANLSPGQARYFSPLLQRRNIATFQPVAGQEFGILVDISEREAFGDLIRLAWIIGLSVLALSAIGLSGIAFVGRRLARSERSLHERHDAALQQALTDPLTGLANRRAFDEHLARGVAHARAEGRSLSVTMLDLNRFKLLNDSRGHAAGDAALRVVAAQVRQAIRVGDMAARLGGDEFAVVHADCGLDAATRAADRIADAVDRLGVVCDEQSDRRLTVSTGTAELALDMTTAELLAEADLELYRAKARPRLAQVVGVGQAL